MRLEVCFLSLGIWQPWKKCTSSALSVLSTRAGGRGGLAPLQVPSAWKQREGWGVTIQLFTHQMKNLPSPYLSLLQKKSNKELGWCNLPLPSHWQRQPQPTSLLLAPRVRGLRAQVNTQQCWSQCSEQQGLKRGWKISSHEKWSLAIRLLRNAAS